MKKIFPMIKSLFKEGFQKFIFGHKEINPSIFNDHIAEQIEWTSNSSFDSEIRTNKLIKVNINRVEFRSTFNSKILWFFFLIFGLVLMPMGFLISGKLFFNGAVIPLAFIGMSCMFLYLSNLPVVFDTRNNLFWKCGGKRRIRLFFNKPEKYLSKLENIHALQLISRDGADECGEEINLVLKDGQRINVGTYHNKKKLRKDAATLSEFLKKPIWDVIYD